MRVLYTRRESPINAAIRRVSAVDADHCGVLLPDGAVWDVSLLSRAGGHHIDDWLGRRGRRLVYDVTVPLADEAAAEQAIRALKGVGYDYLGMIGIPLLAWELDDPKRLICTGLPMVGMAAGERALMPPTRARSWSVGASLIHTCGIAAARADRGGAIYIGEHAIA